MGDHYQGTVGKTRADALEKEVFGVGVEGRGRLVEEDDGARTQESPCNGDALGLSFAEAGSLLSAEGVEAVRKVIYKFGDGGVEGFADLLFVRIRLAHQEVVTDGSAHEGVSLRDIDNVAAGARRYFRTLGVIV